MTPTSDPARTTALDDDELAEMRSIHVANIDGNCDYCDQSGPCDAAVLLDALDRATRDLAAAQAENDALARLVCEWSEAARHLGWTPAYRAPADAGAERTGP